MSAFSRWFAAAICRSEFLDLRRRIDQRLRETRPIRSDGLDLGLDPAPLLFRRLDRLLDVLELLLLRGLFGVLAGRGALRVGLGERDSAGEPRQSKGAGETAPPASPPFLARIQQST